MIHDHEASDDYEWVMIVLEGNGAQHHLMLHHGASGIALQSATKTTVKTIRIMKSVNLQDAASLRLPMLQTVPH